MNKRPKPASEHSRGEPRFAYVGLMNMSGGGAATFPTGIVVFRIDETGRFHRVQDVPSNRPVWLSLNPDQNMLYASNGLRQWEGSPGGAVESWTIDDASGELTFVNRASTSAGVPAHHCVSSEGSRLVVANYWGSIDLFALDESGRIGDLLWSDYLGSRVSHPGRQEAHPHAVVPDPSGRFVVATDLGTDRVMTYRIEAERLELAHEATLPPATGPRHIAFGYDGRRLYLNGELSCNVSLLRFEPDTGAVGPLLQTVSCLPPDDLPGRTTAAIAVHGRALYVSVRRDQLPGADEPDGIANCVALFRIDPADGRLLLVGHVSEGIEVPRAFVVDPNAALLYVLNQEGNDIARFAIGDDEWRLDYIGNGPMIDRPVTMVLKS